MRDEYDFSNSNRNGHENKDNKLYNTTTLYLKSAKRIPQIQ